MITILQNLEPIRVEKSSYLVEELDEMNMVIFFEKGKYKIGYSVNREEIYKLQYDGVNMIGAYAVSFNKRALFIYRTITLCEGYFVRKTKWKEIFQDQDFAEITDKMRAQLKKEYIANVKEPLMKSKIKEVQKIAQRADYDTILSLQGIIQNKKIKQVEE